MKYNLISTGDYLQETPQTWTSRMSKSKWGDMIPQVRRSDDGTDSWYVHDEKVPGGVAQVNAALKDRASVPWEGPARWEQVPEIAYVPSERIKAMEQDGVDVHTLFANATGAGGQAFNNPKLPEDFRLACIQAFNDHQIEEWATPHPGRFITLAQVPLWDVQLATAELRRTAKLGINAITFAYPQQFGYPNIADPVWDPFWDAAQEADLPITFHVGTGELQGLGPIRAYEKLSPVFHRALSSANGTAANSRIMATLLFSLIPERFPKIKFVSSDSGLGWAPYVLENANHQWSQMKVSQLGMRLSPSEYFRRHYYLNFWYETVTDLIKERLGVDNIMWLSDFPHPTSTWPTSHDQLERSLTNLTPEERRKILVDTPVKVFNLTGG